MPAQETQPRDYLDRLTQNYDDHIAAIDEIVQRAASENRDLTEAEDAECESHQAEAEALKPQIERWRGLRETRQEMVTLRGDLPPAPRMTVVERTPRSTDEPGDDETGVHRSAGELVMDRFRANRGDTHAAERVQRALAKVMTSDTPGLLPTPFVGQILGRLNALRPVINSATRVPLPANGMTWRRPKITQHTTVGKQTTEKTEVASRALKVGHVEVSLETYAGAVNMSIQEMERTDPSAVDLVFSDLAAQYALATEGAVATNLAENVSDDSIELAPDADTAAIYAALFAASGQIFASTQGRTANVIYASTDQWARIGALTRPVNPQNQIGSATVTDLNGAQLGGVRVVVSQAFDEGTLIVGNTEFLEVTENQSAPVQLRGLEVGILGYELGVFGMLASLVTNADAFVPLVAPTAGG